MRRQSRGPADQPRRWWTANRAAYDEVREALADQPFLRLQERNDLLFAKGRFAVRDKGANIDSFALRIHFPPKYPSGLPVVELIDQRIPTSPDRHVNKDRSACLYVPEEWLARRPDKSFKTFLDIPVRNFLLGQLYYEKHGRFPPTGERAHYGAGLVEAYADVLGVKAKIRPLYYWLRILSSETTKGHWRCPCQSGEIIRECCRDEVFEKQHATPVWLAKRMKQQIEIELKRSNQSLYRDDV
ncbi:MAG: hypothetical protein AAFV54_16985 [Pseudomonadota bacterium]